jgi:hypothetical protein
MGSGLCRFDTCAIAFRQLAAKRYNPSHVLRRCVPYIRAGFDNFGLVHQNRHLLYRLPPSVLCTPPPASLPRSDSVRGRISFTGVTALSCLPVEAVELL